MVRTGTQHDESTRFGVGTDIAIGRRQFGNGASYEAACIIGHTLALDRGLMAY